jgi:putative secretion ATPase (PEP-CTERM system associated)
LDHDPYGLSDRPFQLTPDPRFYFESATHRKAMTYLGYGLAQGEGFIVVTGEVGTGKTMLVGRLMATIDRSRLTAINLVSTQLEGEDILRIVALALGVATDVAAKGQLLARIERFLHEQARGGKRTLLIVDEAQNLPVSALEELRMLSNFQYGGQALLQIFLLGQPEFRDALAQPRFEQLRQRVIATHHLTPMTPDEVAPYVLHRLACAGWKGTPRFTQNAYDAFHRYSDGVPRRLNMLAGRVMLQGAIERLIDIDAEVVEDVAADLASESIMPAAGPQPLAQAMPHNQYDQTVAQAAAQAAAQQPLASTPFPMLTPAPAPVPAAAPAPPPVPGPSPSPGPSSYSSYAVPEDDAAPVAPVTSFSVDQRPIASVLPGDVPPPAIQQPPRYDGQGPAVAPLTPLIPPSRPPLRAAEPMREPPLQPSYMPPSFAAEPLAPPQPSYTPPSFVPPPQQPPLYQAPAPVQPQPAAAPSQPQAPGSSEEIDYAARNAELEARLAEQEAMLRRTLSLLVELVETDPLPPDTPQGGGGGQA